MGDLSLKIVLLFCFALSLLFILVRWLERRMVFQPRRCRPLDLEIPGAEATEITFKSEDEVPLSAMWFAHDQTKGVILHCHGNAGDLSIRIPQALAWRELGYSVLLFDYRGYGRSGGTPSERGIVLDARAARAEAHRLGGENPVVYGRSLGAFPAIDLARNELARGLVIDSGFVSAAEMAKSILPLPGISLLLSYKFDCLQAIREICCPLLVMHGEMDEIVPFDHGRRLFDAAPQPKRFLPLPRLGHNDDRSGHAIEGAFCEFIAGLPGS